MPAMAPAKLTVSTARFWREVADAKRVIIRRALEETNSNIARTACALGLSRSALVKNMRDLGLRDGAHA